ncbi:conserved Plasmodium protein, unknown function [Plasmodium ovale]|uniref:Uncharacterized protein n=1 Tax=Plasmodium ovale TaxID=36330 RepID=A0A1C3KTW3_PLAOA|nr:conserved Plasmodium protein, unknown function [Plasmodium ovale]
MLSSNDDLLILHLTIHDVYGTKENQIYMEEKPYIKFYWKKVKYKNYLKYFTDEINWFCEFFLPYKTGDYIENLVMQIWANSYLKRKRKVAYNYININDVEKKKKINGKTELIGKRKGLKIIYTLQIICYSLYKFMKSTQMFILEKISIYKMIQVHMKNENCILDSKENFFDRYLLTLFENENYTKKKATLPLKTIKQKEGKITKDELQIAPNIKPKNITQKKKNGKNSQFPPISNMNSLEKTTLLYKKRENYEEPTSSHGNEQGMNSKGPTVSEYRKSTERENDFENDPAELAKKKNFDISHKLCRTQRSQGDNKMDKLMANKPARLCNLKYVTLNGKKVLHKKHTM